MLDQVGNPEGRFSQNEAHFILIYLQVPSSETTVYLKSLLSVMNESDIAQSINHITCVINV